MFDPSKLQLTPEENNDPLGNGENSNTHEEVTTETITQTKTTPTEQTPENIPQDTPPIEDNIVVPSETAASTPPAETLSPETANDTASPLATPESATMTTTTPPVTDINIQTMDDIIRILVNKSYDFVTIEPQEHEVVLHFKKDKEEKESRSIRFPEYSNILIKVKTITGMNLDTTNKEQEASGKTEQNGIHYELVSKVVPSNFGEKIFIKVKPVEKEVAGTQKKKTSLSSIFSFLGALLTISLILGGGFISFVVLNAKTVEDVQFFYSLGINLNDINTFISKVITIIFSLLLLIETILLVIVLFKLLLTKKDNKPRRVRYFIISAVLLFVTFGSAAAWMTIDQKVKSLPNWQELAYGDVQIFDNAKLASEKFDRISSLMPETTGLIGPITLKFDLALFAKNETQKGFKIERYIWDFGDGKTETTLEPTIIKDFTKKGNYEISLIIEEVDLNGQLIQKQVDDIPPVGVNYIIDYQERSLPNGGKTIAFDASELEELGKIEWYFEDDLETPVSKGFIFKPGKIFFEETLIGMHIIRDGEENTGFDRIFVISGEEENGLNGEIVSEASINDDRKYTFQVTNVENDFGAGFIESFSWQIGKRVFNKEANIEELEKSSEITVDFDEYGEHEIIVTLTDSSGKTKNLRTTINIEKNLKLKNNLNILNKTEPLEDVRYEEKTHEYFINELPIPTTLKLDARLVRTENLLYTLSDVRWDIDDDGKADEFGKSIEYDVDVEGNYTISVDYVFEHRKQSEDTITITEKVYIEGVKKDAILDLKIEKDSIYVPVSVRFDASKSEVKDKNIVKFIFDYGDGVQEERDAINPGHRYTKEGDYDVTLTVVTEDGSEYSTSKKLILQPRPQSAEISASLKKAPIGQGIDFSSDQSVGQVIGYFWDFGDGESSVDANPTHSYSRAGNYTVKLRVQFNNNNSLEDQMDIEIYED